MENIETKQKVVGIVYLLAFVSLFTGLFTVISNLAYSIDPGYEFYRFYSTICWVSLAFCVLAVFLIIYNFFAKTKFDWIEIIFYFGAIIGLIVMLVMASDTFVIGSTYASIYASYLAMIMQVLGIFVLLFASKLTQKLLGYNKQKGGVNNEQK